MKNVLLFVLLLSSHIVVSQNIIGVRTASLVDGDYSLEGDVYLELFDDNSLKLRFDANYLTQSNVFDVHVFLTNNNDYTEPIDTTGMLLVQNIGTINGIDYSSGAMTFNLPPGVGITDYDHIVFICIEFGQLHWGNGVFGEAVLGIIENDFGSNLLIYPNPTRGNFSIDLGAVHESVEVSLFDVNGKLIRSELFAKEQFLNILLKELPGIYLMSVQAGDRKALVRLIKE